MTQMELADKLGISFQAVSNWERGNSMPDISKLPELAEIFGVSLDELLGEKSVLVEAAVNDTIAECMEIQEISKEEVSTVLSILKPTQVEDVFHCVDKSDFDGIAMFLPFLNGKDVKELTCKALEAGEKIEQFLPFMDEDDVRELAKQAAEKGEGIDEFLPFMSEVDVRELARQATEKGEGIDEFLPFMSESDVRELAKQAMEKGEEIVEFLPFMNERDVKELAMRILRSKK